MTLQKRTWLGRREAADGTADYLFILQIISNKQTNKQKKRQTDCTETLVLQIVSHGLNLQLL